MEMDQDNHCISFQRICWMPFKTCAGNLLNALQGPCAFQGPKVSKNNARVFHFFRWELSKGSIGCFPRLLLETFRGFCCMLFDAPVKRHKCPWWPDLPWRITGAGLLIPGEGISWLLLWASPGFYWKLSSAFERSLRSSFLRLVEIALQSFWKKHSKTSDGRFS